MIAAALPLKVIAVSALPSPAEKLRPVVPDSVSRPWPSLVSVTCSSAASASATCGARPEAESSTSGVSTGVDCRPGRASVGASLTALTATTLEALAVALPSDSSQSSVTAAGGASELDAQVIWRSTSRTLSALMPPAKARLSWPPEFATTLPTVMPPSCSAPPVFSTPSVPLAPKTSLASAPPWRASTSVAPLQSAWASSSASTGSASGASTTGAAPSVQAAEPATVLTRTSSTSRPMVSPGAVKPVIEPSELMRIVVEAPVATKLTACRRQSSLAVKRSSSTPSTDRAPMSSMLYWLRVVAARLKT